MKRARQYRDRVTVEQPGGDGSLDAYGNPVNDGWQPLGAFWANLRETPGKEQIAAGRLEAEATATLRLRRSPEAEAITAADRVKARGSTWVITSPPVDPDGSRRELEFTLKRGGAVQ
jgi:SPP1 family predicted phage head-tail adaptor